MSKVIELDKYREEDIRIKDMENDVAAHIHKITGLPREVIEAVLIAERVFMKYK